MAIPSNITTLLSGPPPTFAPEPSGRGTISLITSCTITLIICIWTAVHPDIPPPRSSVILRLAYKLLWVSGAALMPEGTIVSAYSQWRESRRVQKSWAATFNHPGTPTGRRKITLEEAFFVVMGGFTVFESTDKSGVTYRSTLTPYGFMEYVREGRVDSSLFERYNVCDKGKASFIAKAIACLQAGWLLVQCIGRKIAGLPLTLLEIHVVIQVICTMVIYTLWWCKPLDVEEPILLQLLPKRQQRLDGSGVVQGYPPVGKEPLLQVLDYEYDKYSDIFTPEEVKTHYSLQGSIEPQDIPFITRRSPSTLLATFMHATYDTMKYLYDDPITVTAGLCITCTIGTLHALAWNAHFPTLLERILWCASSIGVCAAAVGICALSWGNGYQKITVKVPYQLSFTDYGVWDMQAFMMDASKRITGAAREKGSVHVLLVWVCVAICNLYGMCLWIITVESYLSVRSPPEGSFETPRWSSYLPHL